MKRYLLPLLLTSYMAQGQTAANPDSVQAEELGEITVVADAQRTDSVKNVYLPSARQRAAASGGVSLLAGMNIPQLNVNPMSETVKTVAGQDVGLFINFHPASVEDVAGLNPADVRSVEYLDFPTDPRFLRAHHVVNFILRTYDYGGYTKLSGKERMLIRSGEGSLYSKFAFRKMEYDLIISGNHDSNSHIGSVGEETYRFPAGTIRRESVTESARHRERGIYAGLRASWNRSADFSFRNLLSFRRRHVPVSETAGRVSFSELYPAEDYSMVSATEGNSVEWNSELYSLLGRGWSLNATLNAELVRNTAVDSYSSELLTIDNNADEDSRHLRGDVQVNRSLTDRLSLFSHVASSGYGSDISYSGTNVADNRFSQFFTGVYVGLSMTLQKVSGSVDGGFAFESNRINDKRIDDSYPFTHVNLRYVPDRRNSIDLWFQYATMSPGAAMKNPNVLRQSELMYISGNPDLKASRHVSANVSYTWLPSNMWQMSAYAVLFRITDRQIEVYSPDGPDGAMLRKYRNDGNYNHGQIGARLTGKFLDGSLSLSAAPRLLLYKTTGSNHVTHYPFSGSLSADYYLGKFFFNAYWGSGISYVDGATSYLRKMPSEYSVSAGWVSGGWNVRVAFANMFRSSWKVSEDMLSTEWYDSRRTTIGAEYHRRIGVSVTYTFNYGRRVGNSGELQGGTDVSSSILR